MNCDDTTKAVLAIKRIAEAHAGLISDGTASLELAMAALDEIGRRCLTITPSKWVIDFSKPDEQIEKLLEGVIGAVEASSEETHAIWREDVHHADKPMTWKQHGGIGVTIGYMDSRPVHVILSIITVNDHRVLFYEATSTVVDNDMVRAFIEAVMPESGRHDGRINHTNAANFHNIFRCVKKEGPNHE